MVVDFEHMKITKEGKTHVYLSVEVTEVGESSKRLEVRVSKESMRRLFADVGDLRIWAGTN